MRFRPYQLRQWAKLLVVEASMLFLAFTLQDIMQVEEEKTHIQINITTPEPTVYIVQQPEYETEHMLPTPMPETYTEPRTLTADEKEVLLQIAMAEAEGESTEGKAMVMAVVLNRTENEAFPDSVREVVFQEGQFAVMGDGGRYYTTTPNEDCMAALELIESGWDESDGALYFESGDEDGWHSRNTEYLFTLGGHRFYR